MRRILATLLLSLMIVGPVGAADPYPNIRVLSYAATPESRPRPICTVWPTLVQGYTVWVTAAHCVQNVDGSPDLESQFYIGGLKAALHSMNFEMDLAALVGPTLTTAYVLAEAAPKFGDEISVVGHPWAESFVFLVKGYISNPKIDEGMAERWTHWTVIQAPSIGGMSGSPVFNKKGEIVSVVLFSWNYQGFAPIGGGVTLADLRLFVLSK